MASAASFYLCKSLKIAEGTFPGFVDFSESGIEKIGKLIITQPNDRGESLCVKGSPIKEKPNDLRMLFLGKSLEELNDALQESIDAPVKLTLSSIIAKLFMKNSPPNLSSNQQILTAPEPPNPGSNPWPKRGITPTAVISAGGP
jgi:hypothetical protein